MVDILGIELIIAFAIIVPFFALAALALRRFLVRGHVWYVVHLPTGRKLGGHQKPDKNGDLHFLEGLYHTRADCVKLVHPFLLPEAPGFEYEKGFPWPLVPEKKAIYRMVPNPAVEAANGAGPKAIPQLIGYERYLKPEVLPAEAEQTIMSTKIFADMYGGRERLILIVAILVVIVLLVSIVSLARGH